MHANGGRVQGLDSIRFIAASWVVFSHYGPWPFLHAMEGGTAAGVFRAAAALLVNGPAAVIVFFVVSGYCIHLPYARGEPFDGPSFLARRFLRIALPLAAAVSLAPLIGMPFELFERMAVWSLFCELAYYGAYPLLRLLLKRVSLEQVIVASFVLALVVILGAPEHASRSTLNRSWGDYPSFGFLGNTLLGLPCWLLGVYLAERPDEGRETAPTGGRMWWCRFGLWACSSSLLVLRFHTPLGYPWTLDLFAVVVAYWLRAELAYWRGRSPSPLLERWGAWSYSLYLVHPLADSLLTATLAGPPRWGLWLACMLAVYGASYVFYRLVERPSHRLARRIGTLVANRASPAGSLP